MGSTFPLIKSFSRSKRTVLDLEEYLPGQTVSISDWNTLFAAIKAANLNVSVGA